MNYNELIQLYFERSNALQHYWNLYVVIVGGVLAFSSLRKQPAAITTALVCILFALFAYENLDAMKDTTAQRFATLEAIKQFDPGAAAATPPSKCAICSSRLLRPPLRKRESHAHHQRPAYHRRTLGDGIAAAKIEKHNARAIKASGTTVGAAGSQSLCATEFRRHLLARLSLSMSQ